MELQTLVYAYLNFIIYSFLGWIAQGIWVGFKKHKFVNTGFLYGPYVPIYGFGALIILYGGAFLKHHPIGLFLFAMILTSVLEYFTSWLMQKLFHKLWWNYSDRPFNLHGRICLLNSTAYGVAAWFITYVSQPVLEKGIALLPLKGIEIFEAIFTVVFCTDLFFTLRHLLEEKHIFEKIHLHILELEKEHVLELHTLPSLESLHEQAQADLQERMVHVQKSMDELHARLHSHLANAFPDSQLAEPYKSSLLKASHLLDLKQRLEEKDKTAHHTS